MRADDATPNLRGRLSFLRATEKHWREPLDSLLATTVVLPKFRTPAPLAMSQLSRPGRKGIREAISGWARQHGIQDAWMHDAALQTLVEASQTGSRRWVYRAAELKPEPFTFRFGPWSPLVRGEMPWYSFRKKATSAFLSQLSEYGARLRRSCGTNRRLLELHAICTAMWQRGKSAAQIQRWLDRTYGRKVSATNIQMRVRSFADDIGLTLRKNRSGPTRT